MPGIEPSGPLPHKYLWNRRRHSKGAHERVSGGLPECTSNLVNPKHHRYFPALLVHPAHWCSTQSVREKGQVRREEAAATIRPVRGPRPSIPANPARARAWRGGDLSLLSPAPLPPLLGFYKTSSLNQGPSCCPASRGASLAPILEAGARGPTRSSGIGDGIKGVGDSV